jgi:alanine racemase
VGGRDRTWVEIDLEAIRENARTIAERVRPARLLPMVKADGYGLGAVPIAKGLESLDPWGFGVATVQEGLSLRDAGIARRVLVFQPVVQNLGALEACAVGDLTPVLGSVDELATWRQLAGDRPFHAEVDTGMNRNGIRWKEFASAAPQLEGAPGFEGLCTHFHSAEADRASVVEQWRRFQGALACLSRRPTLVHAANSAAALQHQETAGDLVRPGIFLYGGRVGDHVPRPVVSWHARVTRWRRVEPGESVSYGATWRAVERTLVVTLDVGYADGYPRSLSNRGDVLLAGVRARVAGAVTMDAVMVATTSFSDLYLREEGLDRAMLLGSARGETITVDALAEAAGTISYEILTGIGPRVVRVYR